MSILSNRVEACFLALLMVFSIPALAGGELRQHEVPGADAGVSSHATTEPGPKVCVCQYNEEPRDCYQHRTEASCWQEADCIWVGQRSDAQACFNWHRKYCETEFMERPPEGGCSRYQVIPSSAQAPPCAGGDYFYTYHGHGPRLGAFLSTVQRVIDNSSRSCSFSFKDQSCQSFAVHGNAEISGLPDVRTAIDEELRGHLRGGQTVKITANQLNATDTLLPPYTAKNPSYTFTFNQSRITSEEPVSCDAVAPTCDDHYWNQSYLCKDAAGIRSKICCCGSSYLGFRYSCNWRSDVLSCAH